MPPFVRLTRAFGLSPVSAFVAAETIIIAEKALCFRIREQLRQRASQFLHFLKEIGLVCHIDSAVLPITHINIDNIPNIIAKGQSVGTILEEIDRCIKFFNIISCPKCHGWHHMVGPPVLNPPASKVAEDFAIILRERNRRMLPDQVQFIFHFLSPVGP